MQTRLVLSFVSIGFLLSSCKTISYLPTQTESVETYARTRATVGAPEEGLATLDVSSEVQVTTIDLEMQINKSKFLLMPGERNISYRIRLGDMFSLGNRQLKLPVEAGERKYLCFVILTYDRKGLVKVPARWEVSPTNDAGSCDTLRSEKAPRDS